MSINLEKSASGVDAEIATPYTLPRVNLMPAEVLERRVVRRVQQGIGAAALTVVALAGGAFLLAQHDANNAADNLAAEQAVTTGLNAEQEKYAEVPKTIALVEQAVSARDAAMAQDVNWSTVVGQIAATYPADLWMQEMQATLTAPPGGTAASSASTTSAAGATIKVSGNAMTHPVVAAWLDSVKRVPNVTAPKLQSSALTEKAQRAVVDFTSTMGLSPAAFNDPAKGGN